MTEQDVRGQQDQGGDEEGTPRFHVDEGWKESVAEERQRLREQEQPQKQPSQKQAEQTGAGHPDGADLRVFLAGLYTQTLMYLGEVENPMTKKVEQNLPEAQYLIDTIDMLRQKTQGNLSAEEEQYVGNLLHDLRMRYVGAVDRSAAGGKEPAEEKEKGQ